MTTIPVDLESYVSQFKTYEQIERAIDLLTEQLGSIPKSEASKWSPIAQKKIALINYKSYLHDRNMLLALDKLKDGQKKDV